MSNHPIPFLINKGFTLIELMVVLIIMLLIASFIITGLNDIEDSRNRLFDYPAHRKYSQQHGQNRTQ